jgi:hypothetical protein
VAAWIRSRLPSDNLPPGTALVFLSFLNLLFAAFCVLAIRSWHAMLVSVGACVLAIVCGVPVIKFSRRRTVLTMIATLSIVLSFLWIVLMATAGGKIHAMLSRW